MSESEKGLEVQESTIRLPTPEELKERLQDPNYLPSREEIKTAFSTRVDKENFSFYRFCRKNRVFEFLNNEYMEALAKYIAEKTLEYGASSERPLVILEICAGNGRLSHFLQEKLEKQVPGQTKIIATDSGKAQIKNDFPVEKLKHDEAIEKHSPDIVICSWMPLQSDLTAEIRDCDSVKEYILIGEKDTDICGEEWETWGMNFDYADHDIDGLKRKTPYETDGFEKNFLRKLSSLQICRNDNLDYFNSPDDDLGGHFRSSTVSFTRKRRAPDETDHQYRSSI